MSRGVLAHRDQTRSRKGGGGRPADGGRNSDKNLIANNCHNKEYKGGGAFLKFMSALITFHDVQIDHVSWFIAAVLMVVSSKGDKMPKPLPHQSSCFVLGGSRQPKNGLRDSQRLRVDGGESWSPGNP